nr:zinc finger, CCHC-type [Tanacetum cinerariifolium]
MQDMSKDELIPAIDMDTERCKTCMLTKITKKPFQNVKRETKVLELIHSDLCDLHATPSLGNKKYFVTFIDDASRVAVRILDPKLKTLGERGTECIFVGYAEHSKAFRFYVIEPNDSVAINSIIESKDAIFDEHMFSSVPRPSQRSMVKGTEDSGGSVMDVKTSFLNGDLEKEVYMNQPLVFIMPGNENKVDMTKEFLSSRFSMKDTGEAAVILVSTPLDTSEKLMPNKGLAVSQLEYSRVIGCLMYVMTCTRPDIAFALGKHSRLVYSDYPSVLEGYTNASWISNTEDNLSTSGWVFLLGGGAIFWASKKQTCIIGSTKESEFMALATAGKEAEWLKNLLLEIPLWVKPMAPISIHCDNAATLAKAYS